MDHLVGAPVHVKEVSPYHTALPSRLPPMDVEETRKRPLAILGCEPPQKLGRHLVASDVEYTTKWEQNHRLLVTVVRNNVSLALKGRGSIRLLRRGEKNDGNSHHDIEMNGFRLALDMEPVAFESPPWKSSWTTVSGLQAGDELYVIDDKFELCSATNEEARPIVVPPTWQQAVEHIVQEYLQEHGQSTASFFETQALPDQAPRPFIVLFCGAKNGGKSTLLNHTLNRLLEHCEQVQVLDADPGQPEFTLPGCLQLSEVDAPVLVPWYRRRSRTLQCFYYGSVSSNVDPAAYIACVGKLVEVCVVDRPLLVNCDGWIKGLGCQILETLIQVIQPQHIIKIDGDSTSKVLHLSNECLPEHCQVHACDAYYMQQSHGKEESALVPMGNGDASIDSKTQGVFEQTENGLDGNGESEISVRNEFTVSTNPLDRAQPRLFNLPASVFRSVRLISYFLHPNVVGGDAGETIWDRVGVSTNGIEDPRFEVANLLAAATPYVVSLESVRIRLCSTDYERDIRTEDMLLDALNGSVVGLCSSNGEDIPTTLLCCHGLGLVRSVDFSKRLLYVLTPCSVEKLDEVDVLALGLTVHLPLQCYFRGVESESFRCIAFDLEFNRSLDLPGLEPMQSRNTILRRSRNN